MTNLNNSKKQKLLIEYLISSVDVFAACKGIVVADYFNPEYRQTVAFLHAYYDQYRALPTTTQLEAETGVTLTQHLTMSRAETEYASDEVETFCQRRAMESAIVKAPTLIAEGNYGQVDKLIRDAISVSLNRSLGLSYFDDPRGRLEANLALPPRTPTTWTEFDDLLGGGLARGEMIMFSANSGGGKSITLANLALNFLTQPREPGKPGNMNVLYISLELSEDLIAQRFDTMWSGISSVRWRDNYKEIADTVEAVGERVGSLTIKHMPSGTNANAIRAYLKEFELANGYLPDLLVVDYLDIMGPNEHVSADNVSEKDKRSAEQLRDIGIDFKMFVATASQQNRSAIEAKELNHSHIAGGLTKVNTVDWYVSIIMNATMKASGEIGFAFLKTRSSDGVGKTIYLKWENNTLRIKNLHRKQEIEDDNNIATRLAAIKSVSAKRSLLDTFQTDN